MKIQFEGTIEVGNHGAGRVTGWHCQGEEGESEADVRHALLVVVLTRLRLAVEELEKQIAGHGGKGTAAAASPMKIM